VGQPTPFFVEGGLPLGSLDHFDVYE
jgi:hypothetical protein